MGAALIPLIQALLAGGESALAGITLGQWIGIALQAATALPEVRAALAALHPAFDAMVQAIESNMRTNDFPELGQLGGQAAHDALGPHYHGGPKGP